MAKEFDNGNFDKEVLNAAVPVLVDFFTPTCGPCRKLAPTIDKLATELDGVAVVGKVDVSENSELGVTHRVSAVPTLVVFKNGREVERHLGVLPEDDLRKMVEKHK